MSPGTRGLVALTALLCCTCGPSDSQSGIDARLRFWHTFSALESEGLNDALSGRDDVEVTMMSFARGHLVLQDVLASSNFEETDVECPDLVRIDASWLPTLAPYLRPTPVKLAQERELLAEAKALAQVDGVALALPQSLEALALVARRSAVQGKKLWPPRSYDELEALARQLAADFEYGLDLRTDAFWFLPFLRAGGGEVLDPTTGELGIDHVSAVASLERFAALFNQLAPRPGAAGSEFREETRRFREGRVALLIEGPWALSSLEVESAAELALAALPPAASGKPSVTVGGHLFVVPKCARRADLAWSLAAELTANAAQETWSQRFASVPTTAAALARASPLAKSFYETLRRAPPLPRHAATPDLFDDLSPAIAAVVAGDATAQEALEGVARAWTRLRRRHSIPSPPSPER